jgi:N-methylhydantoinase A/oxoprolinase/acetone carboxylase beta subunit
VRIGADSGGTFTDIVGTDGRILKVPSTPHDPGEAVRAGAEQLAGGRPRLLAHGTTVATNALLERRGATVALVTTAGCADLIEIGRQHRPSLYDPWVDRPEPLVSRHLRFEVRERLAADGTVLVSYRSGGRPTIPPGVDAVAVCLLHSDLNPAHERLVAAELADSGLDVSLSCEVSPEFREFERTVTTVVNAFLRPICGPYLQGLSDVADSVVVMTSAGGLVGAATAGQLPASLLLSGPAAGARAAAAVAVACGFPDAISFDMGGTSTDVCLVLGGAPEPAAEREVAGFPIRLPSLDVHTIGAGGGSIASIDPGGALVVGPESAGAVPGPACYGRGGTRPTVTDADLVAGRIPTDAVFPGLGTLDADAARASLEAIGLSAEGVIEVVNAGMEQAVRAVSVERGVDPAGLALVAFGGAGPLHACDLAAAVGIPVVIVPAAAGVLSAVGLLTSPRQREVVRSWARPLDHAGLAETAAELAGEAVRRLLADAGDGPEGPEGLEAPGAGEVRVVTYVDCRYEGQSHELRVPDVESFPAEHLRRNGYTRHGDRVEVTAVRAVAELPAPVSIDTVLGSWTGDARSIPVSGPAVSGPRVVAREDCTIWVPAGWRGEPGPLGAMVLRRVEATDGH